MNSRRTKRDRGERVEALCRTLSSVLVLRARARRELREAEELLSGTNAEPDALAPARARVRLVDACIGAALDRGSAALDTRAGSIRELVRSRMRDAIMIDTVARFGELAADPPQDDEATTDAQVVREAALLVKLAPLVANLRDAGYRGELLDRVQGALPDAGPLLARMRELSLEADGPPKRRALWAAHVLLSELGPDLAPASRAALEREHRDASTRIAKLKLDG